MLVRPCELCKFKVKHCVMKVTVLCTSQGGVKHTQRRREPFAVKSQLPREKAELRHPLKTAYSAGTLRFLERFTTHLETAAGRD